jgi:hypothetical protein
MILPRESSNPKEARQVTNLKQMTATACLTALTGEKRSGRLRVMFWTVKIHAEEPDDAFRLLLL